MWIDNLDILKAEQGILDKKQYGITPKLDQLDEKASRRDGKKGFDKKRRKRAWLPNNKWWKLSKAWRICLIYSSASQKLRVVRISWLLLIYMMKIAWLIE